jgi:thymidylate kinase
MARKVVLLEGGEGTGKTSIGKWLEEEYGYKYIKLPTPGSDFEKIIMAKDIKANLHTKATAAILDMYLQSQLHSSEDKIVYDRGLLSTFAYQSLAHASDVMRNDQYLSIVGEITDIIYLDIDPAIGLQRELVKTAVSLESLEFHKEVRKKYLDAVQNLRKLIQAKKVQEVLGRTLDPCEIMNLFDSFNTQFERLLNMNWTNLNTLTEINVEVQNLSKVKHTIRENLYLP